MTNEKERGEVMEAKTTKEQTEVIDKLMAVYNAAEEVHRKFQDTPYMLMNGPINLGIALQNAREVLADNLTHSEEHVNEMPVTLTPVRDLAASLHVLNRGGIKAFMRLFVDNTGV